MYISVINELDGLAQGQRMKGQYENEDHANKVKHRAANTIEMLEKEFEKKNSHLKALTSKGTVMETISFRSEETDSSVSKFSHCFCLKRIFYFFIKIIRIIIAIFSLSVLKKKSNYCDN